MAARTNISMNPQIKRRAQIFAIDHYTNLSALIATSLKFYMDYMESPEAAKAPHPLVRQAQSPEPTPEIRKPEAPRKKPSKPPAIDHAFRSVIPDPIPTFEPVDIAVRGKAKTMQHPEVSAIRPPRAIYKQKTEGTKG